MNLDQLLERAKEIDTTITNMTSQLHALHGHKTEIAHWISQLQAKQDETQVESCEEPVVE